MTWRKPTPEERKVRVLLMLGYDDALAAHGLEGVIFGPGEVAVRHPPPPWIPCERTLGAEALAEHARLYAIEHLGRGGYVC